ncbi:50S ribosomal protein L24 [Candidatus Pacearchaeota archaeon ex4484_26]|nr:MAG: 50S ribosomal protein L24 [Candidatus Pacearchaeota archaeon ex4484_26]
MAKKFSKKWKGSKKPAKQRKYRANAPLHIRRKFLSAHLSKELKRKYLRRSFPVRKGDTVKILKGEFKGKKAKVASLDLARLKVYLEGIQRLKKDGTKVNVNFDPSNLQIINLYLEDRKRVGALERNLKK